MKIHNHYIDEAIRVYSPNHDERPDSEEISLIVIHCISLPPEEFGGDYIDQLFCNQLDPSAHPYFESIHTLKVSAHLLIQRNGSLKQYVPFNSRAWHAGASCYQGRERCNDFSIGIELEGSVNQVFTSAQYETLNRVVVCLLSAYPRLSKDRIVGHSDIAPGRKEDPGPKFDWKKLMHATKTPID